MSCSLTSQAVPVVALYGSDCLCVLLKQVVYDSLVQREVITSRTTSLVQLYTSVPGYYKSMPLPAGKSSLLIIRPTSSVAKAFDARLQPGLLSMLLLSCCLVLSQCPCLVVERYFLGDPAFHPTLVATVRRFDLIAAIKVKSDVILDDPATDSACVILGRGRI